MKQTNAVQKRHENYFLARQVVGESIHGIANKIQPPLLMSIDSNRRHKLTSSPLSLEHFGIDASDLR